MHFLYKKYAFKTGLVIRLSECVCLVSSVQQVPPVAGPLPEGGGHGSVQRLLLEGIPWRAVPSGCRVSNAQDLNLKYPSLPNPSTSEPPPPPFLPRRPVPKVRG